MAEVRLVDLEIIKRFSLAVRAEYADAQDVLDALEASRKAVEASVKRSGRAPAKRTAKRPAAARAKGSKSTAKRRTSTTRRSTGKSR